MTYKEAITAGNAKLAKNPKTRFIGYGLDKGRALGTLKGVLDNQIIEMPVAENLMMGMAIGLALKGYLPVVFIERMDFLMNAMDALVNHLDKIEQISDGQFKPKVIIRCIVGNTEKPLYTGVTHTQDFSNVLGNMLKTPVFALKNEVSARAAYGPILDGCETSSLFIEYKDLM